MGKLTTLWLEQRRFNQALEQLDDVEFRTQEELAQIYVLGMHKELSQLLQRLNWKSHRRQEKPPVNLENVADDLSDLTKYILCLWQLFGFTEAQMLEQVGRKTDLLWAVLGTEFRKPEPGQAVVMVDMDNTIARYTEGLDMWMRAFHGVTVAKADTYDMAARYGLERPAYEVLKTEWEQTGGYMRLAPYREWVEAIKDIVRSEHAFLVVATARPIAEQKRVWYDCYAWAANHFERIDRMLFLEDGRLMALAKYRDDGHPVLVFEDGPVYLPRLAMTETPTLVHIHPYNQRLAEYRSPFMGMAGEDPVGLVTAGRNMIREQRS